MEENKEVIKVIDDKVLPIPMLGKEVGRIERDTFYIAEHEYGVLFHVYNSMDLIIRPSQTSAFGTLVDIVRNYHIYNNTEGENRELMGSIIAAISTVLTLPLVAFVDQEFLADTALRTLEFINKMGDKVEGAEMTEETVDENKQFEAAVLELEKLKQV